MIRQLHYTSLRAGPSGHSGFQFSARSGGLSEATLRWVERMTAYEKPRDLAASASLSQFPVNLMYARLDSAGLVMLAQVVYAGQDFSQRPGNYFAHALVTDDTAAALGGLLPARLWQAPVWETSPGPSAELPELDGPLAAGGTGIAAVAAAISEPGDPAPRLAMLLSAVDAAMRGGPQVLLVGPGSQAVWQWVAAVSWLLGPVLAPGMTFCTYAQDPVRAGTHVVGTVPGARPSASQAGTFAVVDLHVPAAAGGPGAPGAELLAGAGLAVAERAWSVAAGLGPRPDGGLGAWYPILACALITMGYELATADLAAAVDWLASGQAGAELQRSVAAGAAGQRLAALDPARQARLVEVAMLPGEAGGDLASAVEEAIVRACAERLAAGHPAEITTLRTRAGREAATAQCQRLLAGSAIAARLAALRWASQAGVRLADGPVRTVGWEAAAALLLDQVSAAAVSAAAADWPALRAGVIDRLGTLPEAAADRVLLQLADGAFQAADFAGALALGERWLSARAGTRGASRAEEFADACELRRLAGQQPPADLALVRRLWPGGQWTTAEASAVAAALPAAELATSPVCDLLAGALRAGAAADPAERGAWLSLARAAADWPAELRRALDVEFAPAVGWYAKRVEEAKAGTIPAGQLIRQLVASYEPAGPQVRSYLDGEIPPLILYGHPQPYAVLGTLPRHLADGFLGIAEQHMTAWPEDLAMAAALYACKLQLQEYRGSAPRRIAARIDEVLLPAALQWDRKQVSAFSRLAEQRVKGAAENFRSWIKYYRRPFFGRPG